MENKNDSYLIIVSSIFVAFLLMSNIASQKLIPVGPFIFTGGILLFPLTFILSDVMTEVWSYSKTKLIVWIGFACSLFMSLFLMIVIWLPSAPGWRYQTEFATALHLLPRVAIGTLLSYLCGELLNNYILAKMKLLHKGNKMGLRFIISTIFGESASSIIFVLIALSGVVPNNVLLTTIWSGFMFKVLYEIIALPLSIPIANWLKKKSGYDLYDANTNFNPLVFK